MISPNPVFGLLASDCQLSRNYFGGLWTESPSGTGFAHSVFFGKVRPTTLCHAPRLTALVFGVNNLCSGACLILMQNVLIRSRPCNQNHRKATENPEHRPAGVRADG